MREALKRPRARNVRVELEAVLQELYSSMERHHRGIKLIDRCAIDHPDLAAEWQKAGREATRARMGEYLESRVRADQLRPISDTKLAARFVIEAITTWAVHINWDRFPQQFDDKAAKDNVIEFLVRGLMKD